MQIRYWKQRVPTLLWLAMASCLRTVATPEAIEQVEVVFIEHRSEATQLAEAAVQELQQSGDSDLRLPDAPWYDFAGAAVSWSSDEAIVVSFVIDEFYVPLVYISTDNPDDAHDTCANGGRSVMKLETYWYICQRDWN